MTKMLATVALAMFTFPAGRRAGRLAAKQITIVVPFTAGGTTDMFAASLRERPAGEVRLAFIVENRGGAGGNIGAAAVARAPKDGYTLLVGTVSTHAINPFIYKNLSTILRRTSSRSA